MNFKIIEGDFYSPPQYITLGFFISMKKFFDIQE